VNSITTQIVLGKELSREDLIKINEHRKIEFHSDTNINPNPDNDDWEKPYFLVRNGSGKLVSFGRLHYLKVMFRGKLYPILGIASILSIEKRKGFGKIVIEEMEKFIRKRKMTAIGFCDNEDVAFYEKCGLGILKNSIDRFIFSKGSKSEKPGDVIYFKGSDKLIERALKYSDEKIITFRPEW
jgi:hypothetical protein